MSAQPLLVDPAGTTVRLALAARACDVCGSDDLSEMWTNRYAARTRSGRTAFENRNVVCRRCGFAFVSPAPPQADLDRYYADSLAHFAGQPPSSDVAKRVELVRRHVPAGLDGIEIGGNQLVHDDRLKGHFRSFASVEPNAEVGATYRTIDAVPDRSADALMHYYVLEHATDPAAFLRRCHRILRPGGRLICEVPDLKLYPRYLGEHLWWEHLSHFSVVTLARLAARCGFRLLDVGHRECSHERGFSAAFESLAAIAVEPVAADPIEVLDATTSMRDGLALIEAFEERLAAARREIVATVADGGCVTLWGANEVMRRLLAAPFALPPEAAVVDDDERKRDFIEGITARLAVDVLEHLRATTLLVVASSRLGEVIAKRARVLAGDRFAPRVRIVDYELLRPT